MAPITSPQAAPGPLHASPGGALPRRPLLLAAAAGLATLAMPRLARAQAAAHVVGTLFPMSGPNAEYGTLFTNGVQLALEHVNADRLTRRPIELKVQDSLGTPQGGAVGMTRLASVERAAYVLVGFTGVSKAAAPIGTRSKVAMVNGGGIGPDTALRVFLGVSASTLAMAALRGSCVA